MITQLSSELFVTMTDVLTTILFRTEPRQDCHASPTHPDDHILLTYDKTPGFKPVSHDFDRVITHDFFLIGLFYLKTEYCS